MERQTAHFEGVMKVRPDKVKEFAAWNSRYTDELSTFPGQVQGQSERVSLNDDQWIARLDFETPGQLQDWLGSRQRAGLMTEVEPLTAGPMISQVSLGEHHSVGVTEVIFSQVRPGYEQEFRDWQAEINRRQSEFAGYLGAVLQPPVAGQDQWTTLVRFEDEPSLKAWLGSDARREMLTRETRLVLSRRQHRLVSAFAGWIPEPPPATEAPPDWKVAMLIVLGLFPIVMLQMRYLNPLLEGIPLSPATMFGNIIGTILITYLTMPLSFRFFGWWAFEKKDSPKWLSAAGAVSILVLYVIEVGLFWNLV